LAHIYFFTCSKHNKVCDIFGHKKGRTTNFSHSFIAVVGCGIWGWKKNQDPGSGINIPDPQQWQKERTAEVGKRGKLDITAPAG
jgi:hypothetical protein